MMFERPSLPQVRGELAEDETLRETRYILLPDSIKTGLVFDMCLRDTNLKSESHFGTPEYLNISLLNHQFYVSLVLWLAFSDKGISS